MMHGQKNIKLRHISPTAWNDSSPIVHFVIKICYVKIVRRSSLENSNLIKI